MTTDEILQLLVNEIKDMRNEMKDMRNEMKDMRNEISRIEAKVDANHYEMIERFVNLRVDIIAINGKIERSIANQTLNRRATQATIAELQSHQNQLEEEVKDIKDRLDRAS